MDTSKTLIQDILVFLKKKLIIDLAPENAGDYAGLRNIAKYESDSTSFSEAVIITLVNIEEESTLKNNSAYIRNGESLQKRNPTIYLNLYLLLSSPIGEYETALAEISKAVFYFQKKNIFQNEDSTSGNPFPVEELEKIILELYTMNFEQINHLWGILGGKYLPSVMYKLRLVPIQNNDTQPVKAVKEISAEGNVAN